MRASSAAGLLPATGRSGFRRIGLTLIAAIASLVVADAASAGKFAISNGAEWREIRNQVDAANFLRNATFGPTLEEIDTLATRIGQVGRLAAFEEWIDNEFAKPVGSHMDTTLSMIATDGYEPTTRTANILRYRNHAWWELAVKGDDQLRQRVAWALIQICVTSRHVNSGNDPGPDGDGNARWLGTVDYYDKLVDGAFGNYRDILTDVSYHPVMGLYLSHLRNRKADPNTGRFPDENYAREVMQLFSIGVNELAPNGNVRTQLDSVTGNRIPQETYTNEDIKTFARVFTGLAYAPNPDQPDNFWSTNRMLKPMKMYDREHDTDEKVLLGGTVLPAGQTGDQDVSDALDNLFEHPNCGPFIARRLIQRLVRSNPSKAYIYRVQSVFNDNGAGVRGDMKAVVKAILMDREAINSVRKKKVYATVDGQRQLVSAWFMGKGTEFSRLREPVVRHAAFVRAYENGSDHPSGQLRMDSRTWATVQGPYESPSVFNFYLPDHKPQGDFINATPSRRLPDRQMYAPEFQIMNSVSANELANMFQWDVEDRELDYNHWVNSETRDPVKIALDFSIEESLAADPANHQLLMEHLDLLIAGGTMDEDNKQAIITQLNAPDLWQNDPRLTEYRTEMAIQLMLIGPDGAIQR